ncbi:MAG: SlyX family protein [Gammaproteobacteria bacterium]
MTEKRILELETKVAYQEDLIQELNHSIFDQHKRIEQLENTCRYLIEQTKEISDNAPSGKVVDERPPHY